VDAAERRPLLQSSRPFDSWLWLDLRFTIDGELHYSHRFTVRAELEAAARENAASSRRGVGRNDLQAEQCDGTGTMEFLEFLESLLDDLLEEKSKRGKR
jgi:glycerophosphoryl diester phosphodiesterase